MSKDKDDFKVYPWDLWVNKLRIEAYIIKRDQFKSRNETNAYNRRKGDKP